MILHKIPDGKSKAMGNVKGEVDAAKLQGGGSGPKKGEKGEKKKQDGRTIRDRSPLDFSENVPTIFFDCCRFRHLGCGWVCRVAVIFVFGGCCRVVARCRGSKIYPPKLMGVFADPQGSAMILPGSITVQRVKIFEGGAEHACWRCPRGSDRDLFRGS